MSKVNIFLDLDQTLISAERVKDYESYRQEIMKKIGTDVDKYPFLKDVKDMEDYYKIVSRPGLQQFLTFLFDNFNVSVWTAASKDYCLYVVEHIVLNGNNNRKLDYIFFNYHGSVSETKKDGPKTLALVWDDFKLPAYNKDNTIIIDDYDRVYDSQKENCIFIPEFKFSDVNCINDNYLNMLKESLIKVRDEYKAGNKIGSIVDSINKELRGGEQKKSRGRKRKSE